MLESILRTSGNIMQTSLNHNIAPKQYHNNRLYVRHHRSRPLRCRYSSETTPRGGENDDAIRITAWEDYQATDLIRLANDGEEEGEEEGEKTTLKSWKRSIILATFHSSVISTELSTN